MNKFKLLYLILFSFFVVQVNYGQTEIEREFITRDYDIDKLIEMSNKFSEDYNIEKQRAIAYALQNNIEIIIRKDNGGISFLNRILDDGTPIYLTTFNAGSAITINTNEVYDGGANGLSLSGHNINLGIWDGGSVRESHQELIGRVTQLDSPGGLNSHATHVSGTMIASGILPDAKGMSFEATLNAYDFNNDFSEMATEAANGMLVSNHSYGISPGSIPDSWFGAYLSLAANVDAITYSAQNYLPVFAAGNSKGSLPPYNPAGNGYDLISGANLAKNILCVANVQQVSNYFDATSVNIWSSSSWGPTDDGRIKPDISAKGRLTNSSTAFADDSYSSFTGTSMAAPAVSGSIGLLHEHFNNLYNGFLSAASMRALVIHTAREAGDHPGPDYIYGWGLMDTSASAEVITNTGFTTILEENTLNEGDTYSFAVNAIDPNTPLIATIAWTDPAGSIQDSSLANDPTPRLVNDLDIRIIAPDGITEFLPWKLTPLLPDAPAMKADNIVDNVEKIEVENAQGNYIIEVSHKGNLQDLLQNYTIVVSGIAESDFAITTDKAHKNYCGNETADFEINLNSIASFNEDVTLSQNGLPSTFSVAFSNMIINSQGSSVITIDNLNSQPAGEYLFSITAATASDSYDFEFSLNTSPVIPLSDVNMITPLGGSNELLGLSPNLEWNSNPDVNFYEVEVSTTSNFDDIIFSEETITTTSSIPELIENQTYHYRVRPNNDCNIGNYTSGSFTTKTIKCEPIFLSGDTPVIIDDSTVGIVQSIVTVPDSFSSFQIEDINVTLDISHSWMSDLIVTLTSPSGNTITLLNQVCGNSNDANAVFDDRGSPQICNPSPPAISGIVVSQDNLSGFNGETMDGDWILSVEDVFDEDGGTINTFGIEFCYEETLSVSSNQLVDFSMFPNPSSGIVELNFGQPALANSKVKVFDLNGRVLNTFEVKPGSTREIIELNGLSSGIYLLQVNSNNSSATKKLIIK